MRPASRKGRGSASSRRDDVSGAFRLPARGEPGVLTSRAWPRQRPSVRVAAPHAATALPRANGSEIVSRGTKRMEASMSPTTAAAFLAGALAASTGTAAALTKGHVFQLQVGDHAKYGTIECNAVYAAPYSGFDCVGAHRYQIVAARTELRVLRSNDKHVSKTVFAVDPSGG